MRKSVLSGIAGACLLAIACGTGGATEGEARAPIRLVPPMLFGNPTVKLSGTVYVARQAGLDPATRKPPGYRLLPGTGSVAAWLASCTEPCQHRVEALVTGGAYSLEGLPQGRAVVVEATAPGLSRRRVLTYLRGDTLLDFAADPGRATGTYLVDAPEVVAVEPPPGTTLPPATPLRFRLTFSEPLDPASVTADAIQLTSRDVPGLAIGGNARLMARSTSIRMEGPATLVLDVPGPIATVAGASEAVVDLSVGAGTLREAPSGRVVASEGAALTVSGLMWSPLAKTIRYYLPGDTTPPELKRVTAARASGEGLRLKMRWSEPMATMLGGTSAGGRVGTGLLDPAAYEIRMAAPGEPTGAGASPGTGPGMNAQPGNGTGASQGATPDMARGSAGRKPVVVTGAVLKDLALDPRDARLVTAIATGNLAEIESLEIAPVGVSDPAGNPASGSARIVAGIE